MNNYLYIIDGNITGEGHVRNLLDGVLNIEVSDEVYKNFEKYIWDGEKIVLNPNWEEERKQKERERIGELSMTRGDVFEALILSKGKTKSELRRIIENYEGLSDIEKTLYLNRFDEALDFYRKYPAIDLIGKILGITSEQMDRFFETKDWHELCPKGGELQDV